MDHNDVKYWYGLTTSQLLDIVIECATACRWVYEDVVPHDGRLDHAIEMARNVGNIEDSVLIMEAGDLAKEAANQDWSTTGLSNVQSMRAQEAAMAAHAAGLLGYLAAFEAAGKELPRRFDVASFAHNAYNNARFSMGDDPRRDELESEIGRRIEGNQQQ